MARLTFGSVATRQGAGRVVPGVALEKGVTADCVDSTATASVTPIAASTTTQFARVLASINFVYVFRFVIPAIEFGMYVHKPSPDCRSGERFVDPQRKTPHGAGLLLSIA